MNTFTRAFYVFLVLALLTACGAAPTAPSPTADPFDISVAQYLMDTVGFHGMAETLAETKTIDTGYLSRVNRIKKVLAHTTWPTELNEQAQAFIKSLGDFAADLEADNVEGAIEKSELVHDAQHELSEAIDGWLGEDEQAH